MKRGHLLKGHEHPPILDARKRVAARSGGGSALPHLLWKTFPSTGPAGSDRVVSWVQYCDYSPSLPFSWCLRITCGLVGAGGGEELSPWTQRGPAGPQCLRRERRSGAGPLAAGIWARSERHQENTKTFKAMACPNLKTGRVAR